MAGRLGLENITVDSLLERLGNELGKMLKVASFMPELLSECELHARRYGVLQRLKDLGVDILYRGLPLKSEPHPWPWDVFDIAKAFRSNENELILNKVGGTYLLGHPLLSYRGTWLFVPVHDCMEPEEFFDKPIREVTLRTDKGMVYGKVYDWRPFQKAYEYFNYVKTVYGLDFLRDDNVRIPRTDYYLLPNHPPFYRLLDSPDLGLYHNVLAYRITHSRVYLKLLIRDEEYRVLEHINSGTPTELSHEELRILFGDKSAETLSTFGKVIIVRRVKFTRPSPHMPVKVAACMKALEKAGVRYVNAPAYAIDEGVHGVVLPLKYTTNNYVMLVPRSDILRYVKPSRLLFEDGKIVLVDEEAIAELKQLNQAL